jgi:hypothetical protein
LVFLLANLGAYISLFGTVYPSRAPQFTPGFCVGSVLLIFLCFFLCCPIMCPNIPSFVLKHNTIWTGHHYTPTITKTKTQIRHAPSHKQLEAKTNRNIKAVSVYIRWIIWNCLPFESTSVHPRFLCGVCVAHLFVFFFVLSYYVS